MTFTITLTAAELQHLIHLLEDSRTEGSYYGPKDQYYKRRDRLIAKLQTEWNQ